MYYLYELYCIIVYYNIVALLFIKVNDAEVEKIALAEEHHAKSIHFHECEKTVQMLQKDLKRSIAKSRYY